MNCPSVEATRSARTGQRSSEWRSADQRSQVRAPFGFSPSIRKCAWSDLWIIGSNFLCPIPASRPPWFFPRPKMPHPFPPRAQRVVSDATLSVVLAKPGFRRPPRPVAICTREATSVRIWSRTRGGWLLEGSPAGGCLAHNLPTQPHNGNCSVHHYNRSAIAYSFTCTRRE